MVSDGKIYAEVSKRMDEASYEDLLGKCHALWLLNGGETEEWNGDSCNCKRIQGNLNCPLNPF